MPMGCRGPWKSTAARLLSQRMHVAVDQPIDPSVFSTAVPAGYQR